MCGYDGHSGTFLLHVWLRQHGVTTVGKQLTEKSWGTLVKDWSVVAPEKYSIISYKRKVLNKSLILTTLLRQADKGVIDMSKFMSPMIEEEVVHAGRTSTTPTEMMENAKASINVIDSFLVK